jgi:hypothetical protein
MHIMQARTHPGAHVVGPAKMPVQRGAVELREDVDLADPAVDAVAHGHIYKAVGPSDGYGWLGTCLGKGEQTGACTSAQDDGCRHAPISSIKAQAQKRPFGTSAPSTLLVLALLLGSYLMNDS